MSTRDQQAQKLNKKQRRKHARANMQTGQTPDDEQEENVQTETPMLIQNNHQEPNGVSSVINGVQKLVLNTKTQAKNV